MVRLAHLSDTHLGYAAYTRMAANGLNQREEDTYQAFGTAIEAIIAARPRLVVHSGDLFDAVRPSNRAIAIAMVGLQRLSRAGVPVVVIAGNHETPRLRETGSVFRLLEFIPGVHPVYKGEPELLDLGDVTVLAVPHGAAPASVAKAADALDAAPGYRVALAHGVVAGFEGAHGELGEADVDASLLRTRAHYVALGHHHARARVSERAWYAGSTERFSFGEAGDRKAWNLVELEAGTVEARDVPARPMLDVGPIDAKGRTGGDAQAEAVAALSRLDTAGAIVRVRVRALGTPHRVAFDAGAVRAAAPDAVHLAIEVATEDAGDAGPLPDTPRALQASFEEFLGQRPLPGLDRERLRRLANDLLTGGGP